MQIVSNIYMDIVIYIFTYLKEIYFNALTYRHVPERVHIRNPIYNHTKLCIGRYNDFASIFDQGRAAVFKWDRRGIQWFFQFSWDPEGDKS